MKKEITPDMYNYNKFPGPRFERLADQIQSEGIALTLVENYKDAFDVKVFEQRFSQIMLKFDYIVGDWGNEQLRLRGFYKDDRKIDNRFKISRLEDYLLEYCNYGCAYFVLENAQPQEMPEEKEDFRGRNNRRRRRPRNNRRSADKTQQQEMKRSETQQKNVKNKSRKQKKPRHFNIKPDRAEEEKSVKVELHEAKRGFVIRQK